MGNAWEIGSHTFSINGWFSPLDCHPSIYFIISEMHELSRQFLKAWEIVRKPIKWEKPEKSISGKILKNPSHVQNLGNWHSYFSYSMGAFFQLDLHSVVYFIICEIHGFPHQFAIAWNNVAKFIELREPRKLVPVFCSDVWTLFFHQIPILRYT